MNMLTITTASPALATLLDYNIQVAQPSDKPGKLTCSSIKKLKTQTAKLISSPQELEVLDTVR